MYVYSIRQRKCRVFADEFGGSEIEISRPLRIRNVKDRLTWKFDSSYSEFTSDVDAYIDYFIRIFHTTGIYGGSFYEKIELEKHVVNSVGILRPKTFITFKHRNSPYEEFKPDTRFFIDFVNHGDLSIVVYYFLLGTPRDEVEQALDKIKTSIRDKRSDCT